MEKSYSRTESDTNTASLDRTAHQKSKINQQANETEEIESKKQKERYVRNANRIEKERKKRDGIGN